MEKNEKRSSLLFRRFFLTACAFLWTITLFAQQINISGVVYDELNEPMIGVTVMVEGTSKGVITDLDGNFNLVGVEKNAKLKFTYMGYAEQVLNAATVMKVVMSENVHQLDELVVIGYGSMKRRDVGSAITSVTAEALEDRNAVGVADALQGLAPGLQIGLTSGAPGADSYIQIRGASTFSDGGVSPLFLVDGVIVESIDHINPGDIQGIDILKDAASASIYGARAANGVIIITTKSGIIGKPTVNVRYTRSFSSASNKIPQVNAFESRLLLGGASDFVKPDKVLEKFSDRTDSVGLQYSTNWFYQDLLFRTGTRDQVSANVSGGNDGMKFRASLNYDGTEGIILTSYNKRYTANINVDFNASKNLKFTTNINLVNRRYNTIDGGNVLQGAMRREPDRIIWYPDGSLVPYYESGGRRNPIGELEGRKNINDLYQGTFTQKMDWLFLPYLSIIGQISADMRLNRNERFNSTLVSDQAGKNSGQDNTTWRKSYMGDLNLNFNKNFGEHSLSAMIGTSFQVVRNETFNFSGSFFPSEEITTMNMAGQLDLSNTRTGADEYSMVGIFGRINYNWKSRYLFQVTMRRDASSRFGTNNRWGFFPSGTLAWRFSDENFMNWTSKYLTDGKLRVSYGITGNDRVGNYESITTYTSGSNIYDGISGIIPKSKYGNPFLKWEETRQLDLGIDLTFLNNRVTFTADYYKKSTKDLLSDLNLPYTTGYGTTRVNLASLENKGIELSLSMVPVKGKQYSWRTTINWWKNKNTITDLSRDDYVQGNLWLVAKGHQAGLWYGYKNLGIYEYDVSNAYTDDYKTRLTPVLERDERGNVLLDTHGNPTLKGYLNPDGTSYTGDVKKMTIGGVEQAGGDIIWEHLPDERGNYSGEITDADRQILGKATPQWSGSWLNSVNYKGFTLSLNFYVSWGGQIYNKLKQYYSSWGGNTHRQHPDYVRNGWKYQGQITPWYALDSRNRSTKNENRELNSFFLENGSFIRLQNVTLSYNVESKWLKKTPFKNASANVYGKNLLTWTNYSGYDPEVTGGSVLQPNRDNSLYPRSREFGFGLNVNF